MGDEQVTLRRSLGQALADEQGQHQREAKRREWRELNTELTYSEYIGGARCRGCSHPLLVATDADESLRDAESEAAFRAEHRHCDSGTWKLEGTPWLHCGLCCPWPPIGLAGLSAFRKLFKSDSEAAAALVVELDVWAHTLTCGHVATSTVHPEAGHGHHPSTQHCGRCAMTRGVIASAVRGKAGHWPSRSDAKAVRSDRGLAGARMPKPGTSDPSDGGRERDTAPIGNREAEIQPRWSPLTDSQWNAVEQLVMQTVAMPARGRPTTDMRLIIDATLYREATGLAWRLLPERFGPWRTVWGRSRQLKQSGLWDEIIVLQIAAERDG